MTWSKKTTWRRSVEECREGIMQPDRPGEDGVRGRTWSSSVGGHQELLGRGDAGGAPPTVRTGSWGLPGLEVARIADYRAVRMRSGQRSEPALMCNVLSRRRPGLLL